MAVPSDPVPWQAFRCRPARGPDNRERRGVFLIVTVALDQVIALRVAGSGQRLVELPPGVDAIDFLHPARNPARRSSL
jgi:hypothetical protein